MSGLALARNDERPTTGPQTIADEPHSGMANGQLARRENFHQLTLRKKTPPSKVVGSEFRVADLGYAGQIKIRCRAISCIYQRVKSVHECTNRNENQIRNPSISIASGKALFFERHCTKNKELKG